MEIALLATVCILGIPLLTAGLAWLTERPVRPATPRTLNRDTTRKAALLTAGLATLLIAVGEYAALTVDFYPTIMSDKGQEIEHAFRVLTVFAVPVAAMVLAVLFYSFISRGRGDLSEEAPAYEGHGSFPKVWLGITVALTVVVMIYPGLTALPKVVKRDRNPEVLVSVKGVQWNWIVTYPDLSVGPVTELVIPVDSRVRFDITSGDVLHAFWVPAFLVRIDAIPGTTTSISLRATKTGEYDSVQDLRLQCSQLCGLSHASMRMPLRVVSQSDFEAWTKEHKTVSALSASGR